MIVRFDNDALKARRLEASIGVQGDAATGTAGESEADALVEKAKRYVDEAGEIPGGAVAAREEMADIPEEREHGVEEGDEGGVARPDLNERVLEEARDKARKHGGGGHAEG
jgi:protein phosphatase PTC1